MASTSTSLSSKKLLYKPFVYQGNGPYKYSVYVKCVKAKCGQKIIHFGHREYQHYYDKGGHYKHLNNLDKKRRSSYRARASKITNKLGEFTYKDKNTKNYWAYHYLW